MKLSVTVPTVLFAFAAFVGVTGAAPSSPAGETSLQARQGAAGPIISAISAAVKVADSIISGIEKDNEQRGEWAKTTVSELRNSNPDFNVIVCHTKHDYAWDGEKGVDWDHDHHEFDIKIGGTIGYEIYVARSGKFYRQGDGGYQNWAYAGNVVSKENDGKDLTFGVING